MVSVGVDDEGVRTKGACLKGNLSLGLCPHGKQGSI